MIVSHQGHGGYPGAPEDDGVEVLGRDAWDRRGAGPFGASPFAGGPFAGGPFGASPFGGERPRRYTITQRGGRLVIEALD
jgi:hypothetical protein